MDISSRDKTSASISTGLADGRIQETATSAHEAVDHAAQFGHQAVDKVVGVATPADAWIGEKSDALMAARRTAMANTREYIVAHPLQSVCMAVAAGLLIGRLRR